MNEPAVKQDDTWSSSEHMVWPHLSVEGQYGGTKARIVCWLKHSCSLYVIKENGTLWDSDATKRRISSRPYVQMQNRCWEKSDLCDKLRTNWLMKHRQTAILTMPRASYLQSESHLLLQIFLCKKMHMEYSMHTELQKQKPTGTKLTVQPTHQFIVALLA